MAYIGKSTARASISTHQADCAQILTELTARRQRQVCMPAGESQEAG